MRVIEAQARISAKDATGTVFSAIQAKLRALSSAAESANRRAASASARAGAVEKAASVATTARSAARSVVTISAGVMGLPGLGVAGAAYAGVKAVKRYAETDLAITRIGVTADAAEGEVNKLNKSMRDLAFQTGQSFDGVTKGLESLVAGGMDLDKAMPAMPAIAKTAQAAGAEMKDISDTALALNQALGITSDKMQSAFDVMVTGGKAGKFEPKDMSRYMASFGPAAAAAGYKGEEGLKRIVAILQVIRQGSGSSEEAASSFSDLLGKMETEETQNKFKKFGIDIRAEMDKTRKSGGDMIQTFLDMAEKATKGDLSKLPQLLGDKEIRRGVTALLTYKDLMGQVMAQLHKSFGSTMVDLDKVLTRPQIAVNRLSESFDRLYTATGAVIDRLGASKLMTWVAKDLEETAENGPTMPWSLGPDRDREKERLDADIATARQQLDHDEKQVGKKPDHRNPFVKETARGGTSPAIEAQRRKVFDLEQQRNVLDRDRSGMDLFDPKEVERWQEIDREHRRGKALSQMTPANRAKAEKKGRVPLPTSDPRKSYDETAHAGESNSHDLPYEGGGGQQQASVLPPLPDLPKWPDWPEWKPEGQGGRSGQVSTASRELNSQPTTVALTGSAEVNGQAEVKVIVEAGSTLIAIEQKVTSALASLRGMLRSGNGPGSTGKSSPDAAAPNVGAGGGW